MSLDRLQTRRIARRQQEEREYRLLVAHESVAARLRAGRSVEEILAAANSQIGLWERTQLYSRDYIHEWKEVIAAGSQHVADVLKERSPYGIRMRQNSPFVDHLKPIA